jgi:glycosyltransferase involved in cell wall biosynthesis
VSAVPPEQPLVSVVTPVFNGGAYIAENVEIIRSELRLAGVPFELIVVSDGSVDETVEEALSAGHPEVRVFHYARNLGKGYAVKLGLLAARGRYVGFNDSDLDLHPAELPHFLEAMEKDDRSRSTVAPSLAGGSRRVRLAPSRSRYGSVPGRTSSAFGRHRGRSRATGVGARRSAEARGSHRDARRHRACT